MKTQTIIIIIITLIILVIISFLIPTLIITPLTGRATEPVNQTYTYTKAICNGSNYCEDHVITCEGEEVKSIQPITGAAVQFEDDWEDPRGGEKERLC